MGAVSYDRNKHRLTLTTAIASLTRGPCIAKLPPPCVKQGYPNVVAARKCGYVVAMLQLGDNRQLLLQCPGPAATGHRTEQLRSTNRLPSHSSVGVQCARKAVVIHTAHHLTR